MNIVTKLPPEFLIAAAMILGFLWCCWKVKKAHRRAMNNLRRIDNRRNMPLF